MASSIGVKGEELDNKTGMRLLNPPANIAEYEKGGSRAASVLDYSNDDDDDVPPMDILPHSSHRDGSIHSDIDNCWKRAFRIANRNESK